MEIKSIRVTKWNPNGLLNQKAEIATFVQYNKIDVLLLSETHFTDRTIFKIPLFSKYSTDHLDGTTHGSTAIIIGNTIQHHEENKYQTEKIQATTVYINAQPYSFDITAMYSDPRHKIEEREYENFSLENYVENLLYGGTGLQSTLIGGLDFIRLKKGT